MGMMSAGSENVPGLDDASPDGAETEAPEPTPAAEEPKPEPVKVAQPQPKQSRREAFSKSQEDLRAKIDELGLKAGRVDEVEKSAAEMRERLARYEGAMEEMRRQGAERTPKAQDHEGRIAELQEKAIDALVEKKDWRAYQAIQMDIAKVVAERLYVERQKSAPQPTHPAIPALEMEFHEVAAHPAGRQAAIAFDNFLAAKGDADNPARWRKAYEMAARELGYAKPAAPADKKKEQTLAGVSGAKGGKSGAGRHVKLTQHQIEVAKKSGIGVEEYARLWADDHPEDVADD